MSTNWPQIESIVASALDRPHDERATYLAVACAGNEELRHEVELLLGFETAADEFLQNAAMDEAARLLASTEDGMAEPPAIDGYEIGDFLGAGGMGEVYRARDIRLDRDVAIKVVRSAPYEAVERRFEQEARTASALSHPNIVTIHTVGSCDDVSFIVMELVAGRTLRDVLADGPLSLASSVDIAIQLADALAAAHDVGIVHRDLKPDNVMVTPDGLVKVLDFGIAKRERGFSRPAPAEPPTSSRPDPLTTHAGTAGYMSPEQAARQPVDYRSDQFSLGAILYEMLSGRRAFEHASKAETLDAVIRGDFPPLTRLAPRVPPALAGVVERCLKKDPDNRYMDRRGPALDLRQVRDELLLQKNRHLMPSRRTAIAVTGLAMIGAVTGVAAWRFGTSGTARRRLAVMPLSNPLGDDLTQVLSDGITDILIRQLSAVADLTVISRNTVFQFKAPHDPQDIGRRLNVDAVFIGSVSRRGGRAVIDMELVNARTGEHLWGHMFNRPEADVLAIQNEIAIMIIRDGVGVRLTTEELRSLTRAMTADPEAYALFLRAIHHFRQDTEDDYLTARQLLTQAVARDRTFALGHLTLASTYSVMAIDGYQAPHSAWPMSREHVTRALEHDPELPDAHAERAIEAFFYARDWDGSQQRWKQALGARRSEIQGELLTAYVLQQWALGRDDEAVNFARAARVVDPLSAMLSVREADVLAHRGHLQAAVDMYRQIIATWPGDQRAYSGLAAVYRQQEQYDAAIAVWQEAYLPGGDAEFDEVLSAARTPAGYRSFEQYMATLELASLNDRARAGGYVSPLDTARVHARLGDAEQAFALLDLAFTDRSPGLVFLNVDRAWDSIRTDTRFHQATRRAGLPSMT